MACGLCPQDEHIDHYCTRCKYGDNVQACEGFCRLIRKCIFVWQYPTDPDFNHGHGEQFFRAFDKTFNLQPIIVQEKPSDSTSQSVISKADRVCPVECRRTAGIFLVSHASARIFNTTTPNPRCALAPPNEEPASDFAPGAASYLQHHYSHGRNAWT